MTYMAASRTPRAALALFGLVAALFLLQIGALISEVFADSLPVPSVPRDPDSDTVAATAAEFRVDESGGATYSIPIYGVPGTAGVMPKLALSYSSQGGAGPIGKGWSISGLSSITRCRATMEAGDFISGGSPAPVNFTASDRYCLDGQRLLPAQANSAACPAVGGMTAQNLRTEVESFQRICAYTPSGGTAGVAFFTVNRKDGSTSWYGDRVVSATQNLGYNGYVKSTAPGKGAFALTWAQTRFQDSAGNYMDFVYSSPSSGEHLLGEVRYTGKTVLPGQTGSAQSPYAKIQFVYSQRPAAQQSTGYVAGGLVTQKWRLDAIVSCTNYGSNCLGDPAYHARYYQLNYATAVSGSGQVLLDSIQECRDSSKEICLPATYFDWSTARYEFATLERAANLPITPSYYEGHKMADVNGDGRQDFVYLRQGNINCATNFLIVAPATLDSAGRATFDFSSGSSMCLPASIQERGEGAWHLVDYTGDGRDDLFVSGPTGEGWRLFPSIGNGFNTAQNLIASIPIPSVQGRNDQVQLADLNGDGLIDIVYPRSGALRARIMARSGTSFAWGGERVVTVDPASLGPLPCQYYDSCTRSIAGAPTPKTGFVQLSDFNADAASDLLLQVTHRWVEEGDPCEPELRLLSGTQLQAADGSLLYSYAREEELQVREGSDVVAMRPPCGGEVHVSSTALHEMVVKSITPTTVTVASYASMGGNPYALALGDVNGDGLTEIFHRQSSGAAWTYRVNTGAGIGTPSTLPASEYEEQTRFADANGDGRTDILQVVNTGTGKTYYAYFALPAGGFSVRSPILGGNARICEGSGCNEDLKAPMFNDFDGDGVLDFMSIKLGDNGDMFVSRANQRFAPRDTIVRITNGLGAITQLLYAPLTNAAVYRRETGTRNASNWGRGSPVLDFLAPTYVVAAASSSSPQAGNYSAMATLYYRYANAKFQGGGRGFLGFKEIVTTDPNESGGYVTTQTLYAQSFPYTGMPIETLKRAAAAVFTTSPCLSQVTNACFATPGAAFGTPGGAWFSDSSQVWQADTDIAGTTVAAFNPGVQAPVHVRPAESEELLRDPYTGAQTGGVLTSFTYGAYGNVTNTQVDTITGTSTLTSTVTTTNIYTDTPSAWMLGRLTSSTVKHSRPSRADVVRTADFTYAPGTGILNSETTQAAGGVRLALRKQYTLDQYGNRTTTRICADPATATACAAAIPLHPGSATEILRQTRTAYDSRGRYPVASYELFSGGSVPVEKAALTVVARDVFGEATSTTDLNALDTRAMAGALGRPYYTWTQTVPGDQPPRSGGVETFTTYRWCGSGGVDCPAGARFRQQIQKTAAPTEWTYFDVLGRPIMKAIASFNVGVSGKDASAVCTRYNLAGRPSAVSNPFFLQGTVASGPTGTSAACNASTLKWTTTTYDVIGRPRVVTKPYVGGTVTASTSYSGLTTTIVDERGNETVQVRNGKGELTSVTDANGLVTQYVYYADGSLYYARRDAGRGIVQNVFYYDALGRKVQQNDPDSGISTFEYNALGELTAQQDADGNRIENEIDVRGRVWRRTARLPDGTAESQSTFVFDTASGGAGKLASESVTGQYAAWKGVANTALSFSRSYRYDALGRPSGTTTTIDGANYTTEARYNALGQVWNARDASGRWAKTHFNARGFVYAVCDSSADATLPNCPGDARTHLQVSEADAWGHVIRERRGYSPALSVNRTYWAETGKTASICAGNATSCNLVNEMYAWDGTGNLTGQQKENRYFEQFSYDSLNRMTQSRLTMQDGITVNTVLEQYAYDALGNICRRYSVGWATREYMYTGRAGCGLGGTMNSPYGGGGTGPAGPHQIGDLVSGTDHLFHYYDARGNQTLRDGTANANDRSMLYTADGKLHQARTSSGSAMARFWYGPDGQRYKSDENGRRTLYIGNVEIVLQGAVTTTRRYIAGVALQTVVGSSASTYYLFHNQLGSLVRIADANGASVNQMDFMSFGGRRNPDTQAANGAPPTLTTRGFTGHEMVDSLNLIHMNGRVYDHYAGRFLQPDPVIQAPENAQSWNAYTYAFNNPLVYTDPTGMFNLRQALAVVIGVVAAVFGQYYITQGMYMAAFGVAVAGGFAAGYVTTGTLRGGVYGAFTAVVSVGVGGAFSGWGEVAARAVTGGIMESLQGGNFGNGFFAAGLTAAVMPNLGGIRNDLARTATGAIIGGSISKATGGKFANGAISGAIQVAMMGGRRGGINEGAHSDEPHDPVAARKAMEIANNAMLKAKVFRPYDSHKAAADAWAAALDGVTLDSEVGVIISRRGDNYFLGATWSNGAKHNVNGLEVYAHVAKGTSPVAFAHTHPGTHRLSGGGYGYALGQFDSDGVIFNQYDMWGDMRSAYNLGLSAYSFSSSGSDFFDFAKYQSLQKSAWGTAVPLCEASTGGCN